MNLFNFGREQLENGTFNGMLEEAGIDDVGSFMNQFRNKAKAESKNTSASSASSFGDAGGMIEGAMKAYNMFSGGNKSGGSGGGGFLDNLGSTYQNAQKMYAMYQQFDKNGDGKITVEDIKIYLEEIGLGASSTYLAQAIFQVVDQNHNGVLDFTDLMALTAMLNKLQAQYGGGAQ